MKTIVSRKGPVSGIDRTAEDHGMPPNLLRDGHDFILQNGLPTTRRGFKRVYDRAFHKGMLTQRATEFRSHYRRNDSAANSITAKRAYPPLGHGFLRAATAHTLTQDTGWARDFWIYTGAIDNTRNFYIVEQASDEGSATQWAGIRSTFTVYISSAGKLVFKMDAATSASTWGATRTFTTNTTLQANTFYHIGISYDGNATLGAGQIRIYINYALDGASPHNIAWAAGEKWHGDTLQVAKTNTVFLNRLYVLREHATEIDDELGLATVDPQQWLSDYPNTLECAAPGAGIFEIRFWSTAKDFSSGSYPRYRSISGSELTNCVGYWPCDDGGGLLLRNAVTALHPVQLLPAPPAYVADSGSGTDLPYALAIEQGCILQRVWRSAELAVSGAGVALSNLFRATSTTATGKAPFTLQLRLRTPSLPVRRPQATTSPFTNNVLMHVGLSDTSTGLLDKDALVLYIEDKAGLPNLRLYYYGSTTTNAIVLSDDTLYSIWVVRDRTGAVTLYTDASGAALDTLSNAPEVANAEIAVTFGGYLGLKTGNLSTKETYRGDALSTGAFRFVCARIWNRDLSLTERAAMYQTGLTDTQRRDPGLLLNLEVRSITGAEIPSYCSLPTNFQLGQMYASHHLGAPGAVPPAIPNVEWWDCWSNSVPPYFSGVSLSLWDDAGNEAEVECVGNHRSLFRNASQLIVTANGIAYADSNYSNSTFPSSLVPERSSSHLTFSGHTTQQRVRAVPAADRVFLFSEQGYPHVWTGRALVPLGIDLPEQKDQPDSENLPAVAAQGSGGNLSVGYYSYCFVYLDQEFNVFSILGPTKPVQITASGGSIVLGADKLITAGNCNDQRPIRAHMNPRVSGIAIYRTKAFATPELALAGPFQFRSLSDNVDSSGVDTTSDAELGEVLDTSFEQPEIGRYADLYNGRLVMGCLGTARDGYLVSEAGEPETFEPSPILTEDGTGGTITGVKAAFGVCWVLKTRSIWRLIDTGEQILGSLFSAAYGCVAPASIVEFHNEAMGRRMLFFWSSAGPVLFDGNQFQYLGQPLKGLPDSLPFSNLSLNQLADIHAVDMEQLGQLWVWTRNTAGNYGDVYAYDYLHNIWLKHTGLRFITAGRVDVPDVLGDTTLGTGDARRSAWLAGGTRGDLFALDTGDIDGYGPSTFDPADLTDTLTGASTTTVLVTSSTHANWSTGLPGLRGVVATVLHQTGAISRSWVRSNTGSTVTLETALTSTPAAGDILILGGVAFHLEYPWDAAEVDSADKYFHVMVLWHNGDVYYRTAVDWNALAGAFTKVTDSDRIRDRTYINKLGEVLKLELMNYYPGQSVTIGARAFEIAGVRSSVRAE